MVFVRKNYIKQTIANLLSKEMFASSRLCADAARSVGLSRDVVTRAARTGMPLHSVEAARAWLLAQKETEPPGRDSTIFNMDSSVQANSQPLPCAHVLNNRIDVIAQLNRGAQACTLGRGTFGSGSERMTVEFDSTGHCFNEAIDEIGGDAGLRSFG